MVTLPTTGKSGTAVSAWVLASRRRRQSARHDQREVCPNDRIGRSIRICRSSKRILMDEIYKKEKTVPIVVHPNLSDPQGVVRQNIDVCKSYIWRIWKKPDEVNKSTQNKGLWLDYQCAMGRGSKSERCVQPWSKEPPWTNKKVFNLIQIPCRWAGMDYEWMVEKRCS